MILPSVFVAVPETGHVRRDSHISGVETELYSCVARVTFYRHRGTLQRR